MKMTLTHARQIFFHTPLLWAPRKRLRFGKRSHIAARNLLRLQAEIDELQEFLIDEGFEGLLPNRARGRAATEEALVHYLELLIELAALCTRPEASA